MFAKDFRYHRDSLGTFQPQDLTQSPARRDWPGKALTWGIEETGVPSGVFKSIWAASESLIPKSWEMS